MKSMLCLVLSGPTLQEARQQLQLHHRRVEMIELRLDLWGEWSPQALQELRAEYPLPCIYTLRPKAGETHAERYLQLRKLLHLRPDYLDVDCDLALEWLEKLQQEAMDASIAVQLIHSYHHQEGANETLHDIYAKLCMRRKQNGYIKIAWLSQNSLEALELLKWVKGHDGRTVALGMGEYGTVTRICAPCVGVPWSYVHADQAEAIAPGQLACRTLRTLYRYNQLSPETPLYALLGNPVSHSMSHWSHNLFFQLFSLPALYLKLIVQPEELSDLLPLARRLGFRGFSVTHPLKEHIIPHLDALDDEARTIGAVNTLRLEGGKWVGYNTDGIGALTALQAVKEVKGTRALILGSGGCAKAISHTLKKHGCQVDIMSRNPETGQALSQAIKGKWHSWNLDALQLARYDFLIQATSSHLKVDPHQLPSALDSAMIVMETKTAPRESMLVQAAHAQGHTVVYGFSMFEAQALQQMRLWMPGLSQRLIKQEDVVDTWRHRIASAAAVGTIPDFLPSAQESCYHECQLI